jgi:hypothetical protein
MSAIGPIVGQSAGNLGVGLAPSVGSSETTRDTSYRVNGGFNSWFAGLIDGDGSLLIVTSGSAHGGLACSPRGEAAEPRTITKTVTSFELTLDAKDVQTLHMIKGILGYGSITKRTGVNAFRFRIARRECLLDILSRVNGYLVTKGKQAQLIRMCKHLGIKPIIPTEDRSIYIVRNTAWLSGFFDAEGHFNVMNKYTPACLLFFKERAVLYLILNALKVGQIRYDISRDGWTYTISDREGMRIMLDYLTKHKLHTIKNTDVVTVKSILQYLDKGAPFSNSSLKDNLDSIIRHFKARHIRASTPQ